MTQSRGQYRHGRAEPTDFSVDGVVPKRIVFPKDVGALAETIRHAHAEGLAVGPRGGGTKTGLGNPPRRLDLVVGTRELNGLVDHQPANLTVTVQAGTPLAALQAILAKHGQFLPLATPSPERATVGGILATNASGPRRLAYGTVRDWLIGLRVVHADGTVTKAGGKVVKNVTGYDMNKLYVGSLGTLGIIVEATFKVTPLPVVRRTLMVHFASMEAACNAALAIDAAGIGPLAAAVMNEEVVRRLSVEMPAVRADEALLAVELGGRPRGVERRERELRCILAGHGGTRAELLGNGEAFWQATVDLGWEDAAGAVALRCGVASSAIAGVVMRASHSFAAPFAPVSAPAQDNELPLRPGLIVQPGAGIVRTTFTAEDLPVATERVTSLRQTAVALGGYAIVERCDPPLKAHLDVWGDAGSSMAVMRRVKEQFDPGGVLNPGRFAGGI